jgi:hypothetical protein
VKTLFCPFLCHVPDNPETISRNIWNLLRFMTLSFAWGPPGTAYFRFATAGFPLREDFVPPRALLVLASFTGKPTRRRKASAIGKLIWPEGSGNSFFTSGFPSLPRAFSYSALAITLIGEGDKGQTFGQALS